MVSAAPETPSEDSAVRGHVVGRVRGGADGPTVVFVGAIHGNEPAGVEAARRVLPALERLAGRLRGDVLFLAGNLRALARGVRYVDADLNRHWTPARLAANRPGSTAPAALSEDAEQRELLGDLGAAFASARGEVYVVDLHSTSAGGAPFITLGDTLRNRAFALNFPATVLLGIEEQLDGTLLEHLSNLGCVTLGFEAGQHRSPEAAGHDEAVIWLALVAAGCLARADAPGLEERVRALSRASGGGRFVEVRHRHAIRPEDEFRMEPGFQSFQPVGRGRLLARDRRGEVRARESGLVIMPLYQALGDDGFFLGREVRPFWLRLSRALRRLRVGDRVHWLPGVRRHPTDPDTLVVDTRVARLFPLQVFHLLGFRRRRWQGGRLEVGRRRYDLAGPPRIDRAH